MIEIQAAELIAPFNYGALAVETATTLRAAADRVRERLRRQARDIIEIGADLARVKDCLPHGEFGAWLVAEFTMTERTAQNYMRAATAFAGKSEIVSHLSAVAIYQLAAPEVPEPVRQEFVRRIEAGEAVKPAEIRQAVTDLRVRREAARRADQQSSQGISQGLTAEPQVLLDEIDDSPRLDPEIWRLIYVEDNASPVPEPDDDGVLLPASVMCFPKDRANRESSVPRFMGMNRWEWMHAPDELVAHFGLSAVVAYWRWIHDDWRVRAHLLPQWDTGELRARYEAEEQARDAEKLPQFNTAELWEIDSNLMQAPLTKLEISQHILVRARILPYAIEGARAKAAQAAVDKPKRAKRGRRSLSREDE